MLRCRKMDLLGTVDALPPTIGSDPNCLYLSSPPCLIGTASSEHAPILYCPSGNKIPPSSVSIGWEPPSISPVDIFGSPIGTSASYSKRNAANDSPMPSGDDSSGFSSPNCQEDDDITASSSAASDSPGRATGAGDHGALDCITAYSSTNHYIETRAPLQQADFNTYTDFEGTGSSQFEFRAKRKPISNFGQKVQKPGGTDGNSHKHNIIEKRYRDGLNDKFQELVAVLSMTASNRTSNRALSKGAVLGLAKDNIVALKHENELLKAKVEKLLSILPVWQVGDAAGY